MQHEGLELIKTFQRGELAATETYRQALEKVEDGPWADELRRIHDRHRESANTLRQHLREHGQTPEDSSGAWGQWAKAVEGTATLLGNKPALFALQSGEEYGVGIYEAFLQNRSFPGECCRELVEDRLLPQTRAHIVTLKHLMSE